MSVCAHRASLAAMRTTLPGRCCRNREGIALRMRAVCMPHLVESRRRPHRLVPFQALSTGVAETSVAQDRPRSPPPSVSCNVSTTRATDVRLNIGEASLVSEDSHRVNDVYGSDELAALNVAPAGVPKPVHCESVRKAVTGYSGPELCNAEAFRRSPTCEATTTNKPTSNDAPAASADPAQTFKSAAGTPYSNPGGRWNQFKTYSVFQRTFEIWSFALQFAWKYFLLGQKWTYDPKEGMSPVAVSQHKTNLAIWLREGLVKLGPTFIKIGQQFSTRVDVLAPEFVKELEKLQDNVPPFDVSSAIQIVETSLCRPISEVFDSFDPEPIAAASLGQVHVARLRGENVVVKVQRPGLKELFDIDLQNIRALAVWLQTADPKTDGAARDWVAIYDECSRILYEEIDYKREATNADTFRTNFKDVSWIKVPTVYWEYTTSEVLVMEYVPGTKINDVRKIDAMGLDRSKLARLSVEAYLQQLLRHGFFHADPHPGNVAVDAVDGGRLIYYDFGMMGSIPGDIRSGLSELFYSVYSQDADKCLDALIKMGVLIPGKDQTAVRRTAEFFLRSFQDRLTEQEQERQEKGTAYNSTYKPQRTKDEVKERRKKILATIGEDLLQCAADQPFRFPATFTFVARSFTVLDGIGKSLDPRFDISEISAPYARELLLEARPVFAKWATSLQKRANNQNRAVINLFKAPNAIDYVSTTISKMERGDIKLRVRALEAERALVRVQELQRVLLATLVAATLVNVGTVLTVSALSVAATASFTGAGVAGALAVVGCVKVLGLEEKEKQIAGMA